MALWTLTPAGTLSRPAPARECEALPLPTEAEVQDYLQAGPYRPGFRSMVQGREPEALRALEAAWQQVQQVLKPFTGEACREEALREALRRTVFLSPPLAVAAEDRFRPPPVVTRAIGALRCRSGDLRGAALWMLEHGDPADPALRQTTARWLRAAGFPEAAGALAGGTDR